MMILMSDRVHWFGDGVYDAGPCRNYHIFAIDEHVDRFFNSAALMDIKMPVIKDQLKDLLNELVKKMDTRNSFVYYSIMKEILVTSSSNPCLWCNNLDGQPVGGRKPEMPEDLRSRLLEESLEATEVLPPGTGFAKGTDSKDANERNVHFTRENERRQDMETLNNIVSAVDSFVWGPVMIVLLIGTGIFLTVKLRFRTWRNLGYALHSVLSKEARTTKRGSGDVSPFACLCTALAATIGTGNIVGVATAMFAGGPGALFWMEVCAAFGLTSKFSECMLAVKYRETNAQGEMVGGPAFTMKNGFRNKKLGAALGFLFALFGVIASFGIGNMTQANSISGALNTTFGVPLWVTGLVVTVLALLIIVGGIKSISRVSSVVVPLMAVFYVIAAIACLVVGFRNIPRGLYLIFVMAFAPRAVGGGVLGAITVSVMNEVRYGFARGCFSNEAGMGSAAITAAAATTDDCVRQGYINMTGTFFDTTIVCTMTGLVIASSGVLGTADGTGTPLQGVNLTMAAFEAFIGPVGRYIVSIGIILFAFSTIIGWEYHGEKCFEYLCSNRKAIMAYRIIFSLVAYIGATQTLDLVWNFSDIANALMAIPNLICLLAMSGTIKKEVDRYQSVIADEKDIAKRAKPAAGETA